MSKTVGFLCLGIALLSLAGCGVKDRVTSLVGLGDAHTEYPGVVYPPTTKPTVVFQPAQVGKSCRVTAEALAEFPAKSSGQSVASAVLSEAGKRGAEQVLVGRGRQSGKDTGPTFLYYGPTTEYLCSERCGGWKYGYELWEKQGEWVPMGYREWNNPAAVYETPVLLQVVFLRCQ